MATLQAAGVAAGVVRLPFVLDRDPHLMARGFWHRVDRPFIGAHWQSSPAFREGREAPRPRLLAPTLGEHNAEIIGGLLGLSAEELARLAQDDIVGTVPKPRRAQGDA
jgi:crotonobetainyl-CoA:carnitine CoA-transferase CaiB-like acyl-CoA transferase